MRIVIVTDQYAPMVGGVPAVTRSLARSLAGRGHAVAVLAPSPGGRGRRTADGPVSVEYRGSAPWPFYPGLRLAGISVPAARRLLDRLAPDIMHIHSPLTLGALAGKAARRRGIPVVYTNHYLPANARPSARPRPRGFDTMFYAYLVGFANRCTYVTAPTATALRLLRDRGLRVPSRAISNGVDLRAYRPGPPDERLRRRYRLPANRAVILSVGRLSPEKRADLLLEAAARLGPAAHLALAGAGPDEARLRARAARLGLAGQVSFLGFVPDADLPGLYRLADVFAIASPAELQSLATMEAMASGVPVVAVRAGALPELVEHGASGYLTTPGSSRELADRLSDLAADPARRAAMAVRALARIGPHDLDRAVRAWESLYGQLASGPRPGILEERS